MRRTKKCLKITKKKIRKLKIAVVKGKNKLIKVNDDSMITINGRPLIWLININIDVEREGSRILMNR